MSQRRKQSDDQAPKPDRAKPLSLSPLSLEEALKGAMETGKPPDPENKRAKRTATKRKLKGEK